MLPHLSRRLDGPPVALPAPLDRLSEAWWRARPRSRAAIGVALVTLVVLGGVAHVASSPHGPPVQVLVATRDLHVGATVTPGDLRRATWPRDLVPDGAIAEATGRVRATMPRGAVATEQHVGTGGVADLLPAGRVAVAVPVDVLPDLAAGTHLDLVGAAPDGTARLLSERAIVVADDGAHVWLAVDEDDAVEVTAAAASTALAAVLRPP